MPRPPRIRDYLTYEAHATGAGMKLPPAFAEMPVCYKCNADSVIGPGEEIVWPAHSDQVDYELEVGFFVSQPGRNLSVDEASGAIAGVTSDSVAGVVVGAPLGHPGHHRQHRLGPVQHRRQGQRLHGRHGTKTVTVTNNVLDLTFTGVTGSPQVAAIEVTDPSTPQTAVAS